MPMRTIAQISDLHFGRHNSAAAEDLLASVNEHRPDLVALSGDLTQRAQHTEFAEARRFLNRLDPPKLVVPGNHDVPLFNVISRFVMPFAKYNRYIMPAGLPAGYYVDDQIAVLGVNTARRFTAKSGRVSLEQIAHIRRVFDEVPPNTFKAVVTHHPLAFPAEEPTLELAGRSALALATLAESGVHLLLSGHHHRATSGHSVAEMVSGNSILVLHAGTAISTRIRGSEGNTYNLLCIDENQVTVTVMEWAAGLGFRENRKRAYALKDGRWVRA
jgi:3',5'-cyclic AMP phosphodiesterase CpdA